jgi:hypothetical protein
MEEACFPHLYEPINHTKPSSKTEHHRHLAHAHDFLFFGTFPPPNKGGGVGWGRAAAAAKIRSWRSSSSSSAHQEKRDKYRYEVECVTDVPIGCILNR